jgi:hypothetical protein
MSLTGSSVGDGGVNESVGWLMAVGDVIFPPPAARFPMAHRLGLEPLGILTHGLLCIWLLGRQRPWRRYET